MSLSPREREVLSHVVRVEAIGLHVLEEFLAARIPADEVRLMVEHLKKRGLVVVMPTVRNETVAITTRGRLALQEER